MFLLDSQLEASLRLYYFYVAFQNLQPEDVRVTWNEFGQEKEITVVAGERNVYRNIFLLKMQPTEIKLKFFGAESTRQLKVNGKSEVEVRPSDSPKEATIIMADGKTKVSLLRVIYANVARNTI